MIPRLPIQPIRLDSVAARRATGMGGVDQAGDTGASMRLSACQLGSMRFDCVRGDSLMQMCRFVSLICGGFLLLVASSLATEMPSQHSIDDGIDAYNHLTMSFALLRNGVGPEAIRQEILGNVDYARLSKPVQGLYRELLTLTNRVLAHQTHDRAGIEDWERQQQQNQHTEILLSAVAALVLPQYPLLAATILSRLDEVEVNDMAPMRPGLAALPTELADRMSQFEFDLSLARRNLIHQHQLAERQFGPCLEYVQKPVISPKSL